MGVVFPVVLKIPCVIRHITGKYWLRLLYNGIKLKNTKPPIHATYIHAVLSELLTLHKHIIHRFIVHERITRYTYVFCMYSYAMDGAEPELKLNIIEGLLVDQRKDIVNACRVLEPCNY